jgi:hypothetical protein
MSHNAVTQRLGVSSDPGELRSIPMREKISAAYSWNFACSSLLRGSRAFSVRIHCTSEHVTPAHFTVLQMDIVPPYVVAGLNVIFRDSMREAPPKCLRIRNRKTRQPRDVLWAPKHRQRQLLACVVRRYMSVPVLSMSRVTVQRQVGKGFLGVSHTGPAYSECQCASPDAH